MQANDDVIYYLWKAAGFARDVVIILKNKYCKVESQLIKPRKTNGISIRLFLKHLTYTHTIERLNYSYSMFNKMYNLMQL